MVMIWVQDTYGPVTNCTCSIYFYIAVAGTKVILPSKDFLIMMKGVSTYFVT